ncbi:MAG TPA: pyridoxamine 5'-phosphate oxidase family protein [Gemmatimonadaceae bacterium]|nr:pyridoxamine 5'-phosphate oxidase family protein [Gemmatimonadaceae bacterium]
MTNSPPTAAPASSALAAIEPLSLDECHALLGRHRLCTMSLVDGEEPYAVPLFYGFDGTTLHLGLAEGRKTRVLDANSRVCVTVTEVGPGDAWASVMVAGEAEWLEGAERDASVKVLMEHNRRIRAAATAATGAATEAPTQDAGAPAASAPQRRHSGGRILRVRNPVISGRTRR